MMIVRPLSSEERLYLLKIARQTLKEKLQGVDLTPIDLGELSERLRDPGGSFVTLTKRDRLRGCVGSIEPRLPLVEDVRHNAGAAALQDFRFPPVSMDELNEIEIEISCLTAPQALEYDYPGELETKLRAHIDGVILRDGMRRATFLPQVWEKVPATAEFLNRLCQKMGVNKNLWKSKMLDVFTYQVESFHE